MDTSQLWRLLPLLAALGLPLQLASPLAGDLYAAAWVAASGSPVAAGMLALETLSSGSPGLLAAIVVGLVLAVRLVRGWEEPLLHALRFAASNIALLCQHRRLLATGLLAAALAAKILDTGTSLCAVLLAMVYPVYILTAGQEAPAPAAVLAALGGYAHPSLLASLAAAYPTQALSMTRSEPGEEAACIGSIEAVLTRSPSLIGRAGLPSSRGAAWQRLPRRRPLCIPLTPRRPSHVLVTGTSGSGKSRLAATLARLARAPTLVVDPHGEYHRLLPEARRMPASRLPVNPLYSPNTPPSQRAAELAAIIASLYNLGPLQHRLLEEAIRSVLEDAGIRDDDPETWNQPAPSLSDVEALLRAMSRQEPRAAVLASYLSNLSRAFAGGSAEIPLSRLLGEKTIVDLSELTTPEQKKLYTETLLRLVYAEVQRLGHTSETRLVLVVDEAHLFSGSPVLSRLFAEARKYGVILVAVTQRPRDLDRQVLANTATVLALRQSEPGENRYVASMLAPGLGEEQRRAVESALATLPQGCMLTRVGEAELPLAASTRVL